MFGRGSRQPDGGLPAGRQVAEVSVLLIAVVATIVVVWATVAVLVSVLVGRAISLAEERATDEAPPLDDRMLAERS